MADYKKALNELRSKRDRQREALRGTEQMIDALEKLEASENATENSKQAPKRP